MELEYFDGKKWEDITRDERYYCSELFHHFKNNSLDFVRLLHNTKTINCLVENDLKNHWELGYEVCFFRDFIYYLNNSKNHDRKIKIDDYSRKRTFDLCLFSKAKILIIEAKVQSGFKANQMKDFGMDFSHFDKLKKEANINFPEIHLIGLASDTYYENVQKQGKKGIAELIRENYFSWMDIYTKFPEYNICKRANDLYNN